jgi:hypothetical protein
MAPESPSSRPQAWHPCEAGARPAARAASRRRRQIFFVLAGMLALVGAIAGWLLFLNPFRPPTFLTITITEYKDPRFPLNAFARRDRDTLQERFQGSQAHDYQTRRLLAEQLDALRDQKGKAVVVHLCAFARTGPQGTLYLLPADAHPDDRASWLPLERVLDSLGSCPASHKLLILDIHRPLDDPRLGTPVEDVGARFQELLRAKAPKKLLVLCACSPGQRSLVSEELGHSVFAHYLDEGLRGYADGYNPQGKRDGRVSVKELAAFVTARVDRWALRNRGVRQTPVLLGEGGDFDLISLERGRPQRAAPPEVPDRYPAQLRQGWKTRDRWLADGTYLKAPQVVHQLEELLLRLEQRARGGDDPRQINHAIKVRRADLDRQIDRLEFPRPEKIYSLSLVKARAGLWPDPLIERYLRQKLPGLKPGAKPGAADKVKKEFAKKFKKVSDARLGWTIFLLAADEDTPCTEQIHYQVLGDLIRSRQDLPRFVETLPFYRAADLKIGPEGWPKETVHRLFRVIREGEKALACDPRHFPWVRPLLEAAALSRQQGESLFFAGDPDNLGEVNRLLEQAEKKYRDINGYLAIIRKAFAGRDEGLRLLPGYLPYLAAPFVLAGRSNADRIWLKAVRELRGLDRLLANPPGGAGPDDWEGEMASLEEATGRLRKYLARNLRRPLVRQDPRRLMAGGAGEEEAAGRRMIVALHEVNSILLTPWPTARERATLWKDRRLLARELDKRARALDAADDQGQKPTRPADALPGKQASPNQAGQALRRVKFSVALLGLAGLPQARRNRLEKMLAAAEAGGAGPSAWAALAGGLRQAWFVQLPGLVKKADPVNADRLVRLLHPVSWESGAGGLGDDFNPTAQLRRRQTAAYWQWLGRRYQERGRAEKNDLAREFYLRAGKDYLEAAP